jgi:hypothetical protein
VQRETCGHHARRCTLEPVDARAEEVGSVLYVLVYTKNEANEGFTAGTLCVGKSMKILAGRGFPSSLRCACRANNQIIE